MRTLPEIDRDIEAVEEEMARRHPELRRLPRDYLAAAVLWQFAWDAEPELRDRERALYRERGDAQQERDRAAYEAMTAARRSNAAKRAARTSKAQAAVR